MRAAFVAALQAWETVIVLYFIAANSIYLVYTIVAVVQLIDHRRRWTAHRLDAIFSSPATPGISIVAPAYNEQASITESVRSLLLLRYPNFEVVVVNDGSSDDTLAAMLAAFELLPAPAGYPATLRTEHVHGVYRSPMHPGLVLIDKANGGKSDAINAGINAARHPLVCVIDADSVLEADALTRAALPFLEDPSTLAAGGIVRIANGCTVESGRVTRVGLPRSWLARLQVVEYLRAFLAGRVAQSSVNGLLVISGAFGLFSREAVIGAGGFLRDTVGEDMEIVTRLHRWARDTGRRYRIVFQPDPVCWTEAPDTLRALRTQRNRWQRGTLQVLARHRDMIGRRKYGGVGLFAMPQYVVFEAAGPTIEVTGYVMTIAAALLGVLDWKFAWLFFLAAVLYGALISLSAVLLEEISFRRYPRMRDLLVLALVGIAENFGYRQLTAWWRVGGTIDFFRRRQSWGVIPRKGFARI